MAQLANLTPTGGGGTTFAPAQPGIIGDLGKLAGGVGGALTGAASFSDINLKTNIEYVDKEKGHNIYEFNYKDIPNRRFRGVMAQEVLEICSKAVSKINGYLAVNYRMLGLEMREVTNG